MAPQQIHGGQGPQMGDGFVGVEGDISCISKNMFFWGGRAVEINLTPRLLRKNKII